MVGVETPTMSKKGRRFMIRLENNTTKEKFLRHIELFKEEIHPMQIWTVHVGDYNPFRNWKFWELSDPYNKWIITFTGEVGEFKVEGEEFNGKPFVIYLYLTDSQVEIHMALENGRRLKADRFLNKYKLLAYTISCYFKFGYLK